MGTKVHVGDVFAIPISESHVGIGLVSGDWKGELFLVVFEGRFDRESADPGIVRTATPLFAALSLDAKLYHGHWTVLDHHPEAVGRILQPDFKVEVEGQTFIESRDRTITRPATALEIERLRYRTVVAPVRLEKALQAFHGLGEWLPHYNELKAEYALQSARDS
jgi:hypothetical protein